MLFLGRSEVVILPYLLMADRPEGPKGQRTNCERLIDPKSAPTYKNQSSDQRLSSTAKTKT